MYVKLVLERKYGKQITPNDVIPETEMKIIDVDIPDIDNKEPLIKGRWYIVGYCEPPITEEK